jgi:hypothetical protein
MIAPLLVSVVSFGGTVALGFTSPRAAAEWVAKGPGSQPLLEQRPSMFGTVMQSANKEIEKLTHVP